MADDAGARTQLTAVHGPPELSGGEQVILAALRLWAGLRLSGEAPQPCVRRLMAEQVSDRAGAIFVALMEALERQTRRPLQIACGACSGCGEDEQRLIVACGVSRVDMRTARALLSPLVSQPEPVAIFARALNMVLSHEGLDLPVRMTDGPRPVCGRPAGATLH
ncbi:MAG: hypothetical protein Q7V15_07830 [Phenylobacterium sp.]|uniref:hypothetical protein n=1 Tax=Phenylobacterium sp. TaxID=1871053 RepID=UPI00271D0B93|nr:hypothetical protein [Phenylobacterium sp.]MDO8901247.1 hypothetical protein [Phenylobacterium sp.]